AMSNNQWGSLSGGRKGYLEWLRSLSWWGPPGLRFPQAGGLHQLGKTLEGGAHLPGLALLP
ncbi:MAG: hypothetical protein WBD36_03245, partial [Bacteroidota bacterium]